MNNSEISTRMKAVIQSETEEGRRYKRLETELGVNANSWKSWFHGRQRATEEMIQSVCKHWPQYAFWIATGVTDPKHGHIAPGREGFPELGMEQPSSTRYFREAIAQRDAATRYAPTYFGIDHAEWIQDGRSLISDSVLRYIAYGARFEEELASEEIREHNKRRQIAAKLRTAEIGLYEEMPEMDYEETEVVKKAIERQLTPSIEKAMANGMHKEAQAIQQSIDRLTTRIETYKRVAGKN